MSPETDRLCDEFEIAWRQGRPLSIESLLRRVHPSERGELLEELIRVEGELRREAGEVPGKSEYLRRFPDDERLVRSAWSTDELSVEAIGWPREAARLRRFGQRGADWVDVDAGGSR